MGEIIDEIVVNRVEEAVERAVVGAQQAVEKIQCAEPSCAQCSPRRPRTRR